MICFPLERKRGARTSFSMRRFFDVIEELRLRDIPYKGVLLLGEEEETMVLCLNLIGFYFLVIGKNTLVMWFKQICLGLPLIIPQFY